ncbi:MAG: hypothetical protein ACKERF_00485 [Candidatus Hodgkinia cicadicola]
MFFSYSLIISGGLYNSVGIDIEGSFYWGTSLWVVGIPSKSNCTNILLSRANSFSLKIS